MTITILLALICGVLLLLLALIWREVIAMNRKQMQEAAAHDRAVAHTDKLIAALRSELAAALNNCLQLEQQSRAANDVAQNTADTRQSRMHENDRLIDECRAGVSQGRSQLAVEHA